MSQFPPRSYSVNDFLEWNQRDQLVLSPKFQRRQVWTAKAKSYLLDSVIRGKPIPKILIREHIDPSSHKTIREVVDGQQRLRAIIEFIDGAFAVSRTHNKDYAGQYFAGLPANVQDSIRSYMISTDCLGNIPDEEVRDIFARLNTYGVKLNKMELLHAEYYGDFRTSAFEIGNEFGRFWLQNKILTESQVARMGDAELAADLLVVLADGIKDKGRIKNYFKAWDDQFPNRGAHERAFRGTMDTIGELFNDGIAQHEFRRPVLFYSLFCAVAHMHHPVPGLPAKRAKLIRTRYSRVAAGLSEVDRIWTEGPANEQEHKFHSDANRATTHEQERVRRAQFLCGLIRKALA